MEHLEKIKSFIKKSTPWQRTVVIFVVVIFVAIIIALINPKKKLLEMRNSQRRSDIVNILNSVYQYSIDNNGALPESIGSEPTMICKSNAPSCVGLVDISKIIGNKKYLLSSVPVDPGEKNANSSGYQISKSLNGRIRVAAPLAENKAVISLSK